MNSIDISKSDQAVSIIKPMPNVIEAICADTVFFFKSVQEVSTPERKAVLLQNINFLKLSIDSLEILLGEING